MSKLDTIKELRALTQAGMKDCTDALVEASGDIQRAVDIIKTKGLNLVSNRAGNVASEGSLGLAVKSHQVAAIAEVNCQTDFVARLPDFRQFVGTTAQSILDQHIAQQHVVMDTIEENRQALVAITKENIVVRRWWIEEAMDFNVRIFSYIHLNDKVGALLTLLAPSEDAWTNSIFAQLGEDLLMQITAMNPISISVDTLPPELVERQRSIFENQLREAKKPQVQWEKILAGKFNKWYSEVCLLKQESIITPKTSVEQTIKQVGEKLGGEISIVNFIRCQVGDGLEPKKSR